MTRRAAALCLLVLAAHSATAQQPRRERPRLVVLIVVDQLRGDYLSRFDEQFASGGFRRLTGEGAYFANAYFSYSATATAAGHATIATGRLPRQHGICANGVFADDEARDMVATVADPAVRLVGRPEGSKKGASPRALRGPSLGDELRLADRRSKVISIALKDRAAIFMGGRAANAAYWWNSSTGNFVTSSYYLPEPAAAVQAMNGERWADRFAETEWAPLLPEGAYAGCYPVMTSVLVQTFGLTPQFPHALPPLEAGQRYFSALQYSPFGNELVLELAARLLTAEALGTDEAPDLLCIGLSSNDYVGHVFGPESPQVRDITIRTDRQLAAFFEVVDKSVGLDNCAIALSADHGVTTIGYVARQLKLTGGRIRFSDAVQRANDAIRKDHAAIVGEREVIRGVDPPWVHLWPFVQALPAAQRSAVSRAAAEALRATEGVSEVFEAEELRGPPPSREDFERWLAWRCYHPSTAGDLFVRMEPFWYEEGAELAGHSAGGSYDRHVPVLIRAPGVRPGRYFAPADPLDIAPTLSAILGISAPLDSTGRVLHECLAP